MSELETVSISRFDSIRGRLIAAFILIVLIPMAIISAVLAISGSEGAQAQLASALDMAASFKESAISAWKETIKAELASALIGENTIQYVNALAMNNHSSRDHQIAKTILTGRFRQVMSQVPFFDGIFLTDRAGRIVLSTETAQEGQEYADQVFFRDGLKGPVVHLSTLGQTMVIVARPVVDDNGVVLGVLAGHASLEPLNKIMLVPTGLGKTGRTYLVSSDRTLLTAVPGIDPGTQVQSQGISAALASRSYGSSVYTDFRGVTVIGAYRWLPELGLALMAEQEQSEFSRATHVVLVVNASVALAAIFIAAIASLSFTRSIATPLTDLSETASRIAAGQLELAAEVHRKDEIGALAQTFNFMTNKLKQTMEGLRKSEEQYRGIFENAMEGVFQSSFEGFFLNVNPAMARILGYDSPAELLAGLTDIRHQLYTNPEDRDVFLSLLLEQSMVSGFEVGFNRKDKQQIWVSLSARIVRTDDGTSQFIEGLCADITDRKHAEDSLRKSEEKYHTLVDNLSVGVYRTTGGAEGNFLQANPAMMKIFGYDLFDEFVKVPVLSLYQDPADRRSFIDELTRVGYIKDRELAMRRKDGSPIWILCSANAMFDENREIKWIDGVNEDITERKQLEIQLRQAQKMEAIGTLAGGVAHDFNNILTAIIGYGNLLKMKIEEDQSLRYYLDPILSSAEKAAQLTQSLLAFSRKQIIRLQPVSLNEIVDGMGKLLLRVIGEDIELQIEQHDGVLLVLADRSQIEQVILNLVTNARDAMPEGGAISIETDRIMLTKELLVKHEFMRPGDYAVISVSDTGIGMDEDTRSRIFEPFFSTKTVGKGTGLGLSIVYGIVKQHNGDISVYSELGKGTSFRIYLPLAEEGALRGDGYIVESPAVGGTETILIGEDNDDVRRLAKDILTYGGYTVILARDGEDALAKFRENADRIDMLLLDVVMPKKNGKEVYDEVTQQKPGVKVLFMSGYTANIIHKKGVLEEGLNFIPKPLSPDRLLRKVRTVLSLPVGES